MKQILFAACMLYAIQLMGQDVNKKISFAIKVGAGSSNLRPSITDSEGNRYTFKNKTTLISGMSLYIPVGNKMIFKPELILVSKGAKEKYEGQNLYTYPRSFFYMELPLNIARKISTKSGFLMIGGGPAPALLFDEMGYLEGADSKNFDLGINLISSYHFPIGFSIELNYNIGLLDVYTISNKGVKNSYLSLCIGYAF